MQQLVNSTCVLCQQRIGSIVEGRFCARCGSPVHKRCIRPESAGAAENMCSACGANRPEIVVASPKAEPPVDAPRRTRRLLFIACAVAAGIVFCIAYFWVIPTVRYAINASKPARRVSAEQLRQEIREDVKETQSNYPPGTPLIVSGVVIGIEGPALYTKGPYDVILTGKDENPGEFPWITCKVVKEYVASSGPIKPDDVVTVRGFCFVVREEGVWLTDCTLLEHGER